jgi:hypothetical protein
LNLNRTKHSQFKCVDHSYLTAIFIIHTVNNGLYIETCLTLLNEGRSIVVQSDRVNREVPTKSRAPLDGSELLVPKLAAGKQLIRYPVTFLDVASE